MEGGGKAVETGGLDKAEMRTWLRAVSLPCWMPGIQRSLEEIQRTLGP